MQLAPCVGTYASPDSPQLPPLPPVVPPEELPPEVVPPEELPPEVPPDDEPWQMPSCPSELPHVRPEAQVPVPALQSSMQLPAAPPSGLMQKSPPTQSLETPTQRACAAASQEEFVVAVPPWRHTP